MPDAPLLQRSVSARPTWPPPYWLLVVLCAVLAAGCDSGTDPQNGSFFVEIQGDVNVRLEGAAQFFLNTAPDSDAPTSFEIVLTAQTSELIIESIDGSGGPEEATYAVERAATGASEQAVRVEFDPERFTTTSELFIAEAGTLTLTRVTEAVVEGTFNLDARGTTDPEAEIILIGEFSVVR